MKRKAADAIYAEISGLLASERDLDAACMAANEFKIPMKEAFVLVTAIQATRDQCKQNNPAEGI